MIYFVSRRYNKGFPHTKSSENQRECIKDFGGGGGI